MNSFFYEKPTVIFNFSAIPLPNYTNSSLYPCKYHPKKTVFSTGRNEVGLLFLIPIPEGPRAVKNALFYGTKK
jgi:hypothetical protein